MTPAGAEYIDKVVSRMHNFGEKERNWRWMLAKDFFPFWEKLLQPGADGQAVVSKTSLIMANLDKVNLKLGLDFRTPSFVTSMFKQFTEALHGECDLNVEERRAIATHLLKILEKHQGVLPKRTTRKLEKAFLKAIASAFADPGEVRDATYIIRKMEELYDATPSGFSILAFHHLEICEKAGSSSDDDSSDDDGPSRSTSGRNKKKRKGRDHSVNAISGAKQGGGSSTAKPDKANKKQKTESKGQQDHGPQCRACGRRGHKAEGCVLLKHGHPDCNKTSALWPDSEQGKKYKKAGKTALSYKETLSQADFAESSPKLARLRKPDHVDFT